MSRTFLMAAAAVTALGFAGCNKQSQTAQNPPSAVTPQEQAEVPSAHPGATVLSTTDITKAANFVPKAAASDMFEVASSKIALDRSQDPKVKDFARMMIREHGRTTDELKSTLKGAGQDIAPPTALPNDLQAKIDDLNKAAPDKFDATYLQQQIDAHQATLDVMQRYAKDGDVEPVKQFAAKTAPTVQQHLTMAKSLKDQLAKAGPNAPGARNTSAG